MKQFKRILAMFLCAVMVFGILPAFPFAASAETETSSTTVWEWNFDDEVLGWTQRTNHNSGDLSWSTIALAERDEGAC